MRRFAQKVLAGTGVLGLATGLIIASTGPAFAQDTPPDRPTPGEAILCAQGNYETTIAVGRTAEFVTSPIAKPGQCVHLALGGTAAQGDVSVEIQVGTGPSEFSPADEDSTFAVTEFPEGIPSGGIIVLATGDARENPTGTIKTSDGSTTRMEDD